MTEREPAHRAILHRPEAKEPTPPPPPASLRGIALLIVVAGVIVWWIAQSDGEEATVVASRATLEAGAPEQDVLPGSLGRDVVVVDERVQEELSSLRSAEIAWLASGEAPRSLPPCPALDPFQGLQPWGGPCRKAWSTATLWALPDASPCRYQIFAAPPDDFRLVAECDADGDGEFETWVADRTTPPHRVVLGRR